MCTSALEERVVSVNIRVHTMWCAAGQDKYIVYMLIQTRKLVVTWYSTECLFVIGLLMIRYTCW